MGKIKGFFGVLLAALLLLPLGGAGLAGAAPKMVIDRSHGQTVDLSGLTGDLASQASGVSQEWEVSYVEPGQSVGAALSDCNLLVVTQPLSEFLPEEVSAVRSYVESGGGLWVLYNAMSPSGLEPPNDLPEAFGVNFSWGPVSGFDANSVPTYTLTMSVPDGLRSHPLFDRDALIAGDEVTSFNYPNGASLFPSSNPYSPAPALDLQPIFPVVVTAGATGMDEDRWVSEPVVLVAGQVGEGRVVFIGDTTLLDPSADAVLSQNIIAWLMKPEPDPQPDPEPVPPKESGPISVTINVRPWSPDNKIKLNSKHFLRVAVMTTLDFDAAQVDPKSVAFAGAKPVYWKLRDVDRDGDKDCLLVFWIPDLTELTAESTETVTEAVLSGKTVQTVDVTRAALVEGTSFEGKDWVRIAPEPKKIKKLNQKGSYCRAKK